MFPPNGADGTDDAKAERSHGLDGDDQDEEGGAWADAPLGCRGHGLHRLGTGGGAVCLRHVRQGPQRRRHDGGFKPFMTTAGSMVTSTSCARSTPASTRPIPASRVPRRGAEPWRFRRGASRLRHASTQQWPAIDTKMTGLMDAGAGQPWQLPGRRRTAELQLFPWFFVLPGRPDRRGGPRVAAHPARGAAAVGSWWSSAWAWSRRRPCSRCSSGPPTAAA